MSRNSVIMDTSEFRHDGSVYPGALCEDMGDSPNLKVGFSPVLDQHDPLFFGSTISSLREGLDILVEPEQVGGIITGFHDHETLPKRAQEPVR